MPLADLRGARMPATADFHGLKFPAQDVSFDPLLIFQPVHLRDGAMSSLVVPTIMEGGVDLVMVMASRLFLRNIRSSGCGLSTSNVRSSR